MAYRDGNGTITIDEVAANADCARIDKAIAFLNTSKESMQNLIKQAADGQGQTTIAVAEKCAELTSMILDLISRLEETKSFIKRTVAHYQQVDASIKSIILASEMGGNA